MWEIREQIEALLASTYMTKQEVAEAIGVHPTALSRALRDVPPTKEQSKLLLQAHRVLTERQEALNRSQEEYRRRAQEALEQAGSLASTAR